MFGMGFTEIVIILVIAILFLGPDKLPSAMVDIAKFFRQMKKTVGSMKESLEEEMNVSEIKNEALAYKQQLLDAQHAVEKMRDPSQLGDMVSSYADDLVDGEDEKTPKAQEEEVTFKKKKKKKENDSNDKEEDIDV